MNDPRDINDPQCAAWYRTSPLWQIWTTGHRDGPVERTAWAMAVASLLPPAWIAFDTTLTNIEDLLAPLAVRLVANWRPGRVPLFCECYDVPFWQWLSPLSSAGFTSDMLSSPT